MNLDEISPEIKARAKECKSPEEILALAKEAGYKLSDDELSSITGGEDGGWCAGNCCGEVKCPCWYMP